MPLSDRSIRAYCKPDSATDLPLITPFTEGVKEPGIISYGLTHAGYDLRLAADEVWAFTAAHGEVIDPKMMGNAEYRDHVFVRRSFGDHEPIVIPANGYILGRSYETINMPRFLEGLCVGKSTLARCGVLVNTTPLEPGWSGKVTLEIANLGGAPVKIYAMEGICQVLFFPTVGTVEQDYREKGGIYQNQVGVTPARIRQ